MLQNTVNRRSRMKDRQAPSKRAKGRPMFFMVLVWCVITQLFCTIGQPAPAITPSSDIQLSSPTSNLPLAIQAQAETETSAPTATTTLTNNSGTSTQTAITNFVSGSTIQHKIVPGEWMMQIARCYGADFGGTRRANPQIFDPNLISPNTILTVPNIGSNGPIYGPPCVGYHTVQAGDTWSSIAQTYNADVVILQAANRGALSVGKVLRVPLNSAGGITQSPTNSSPTPAPATAVESATTFAPTVSTESSVTPVTTIPPEETPIPGAATSELLIDQALAAGSINSETALLYKVYASFNDSRLPAQYRGDDSQVTDSNIISEVADQYQNLSPATQTILDPFLLPPSAPDSWVNLPTIGAGFSHLAAIRQSVAFTSLVVWRTVHNPGSNVKVWFQTRYAGDGQKARLVADAIDNVIWKKLTDLMGVPLSDIGLKNNGGDALFDIYLVSAQNQSVPYNRSCVAGSMPRAHYMLLNHNSSMPIVAHELMHAIIANYKTAGSCNEYHWLDEASATWAEDFVYETENTEHARARVFLDFPSEPLFSLTGPDKNGYRAYLFPFFLTRSLGQPSLMRTIWENAAQYGNSLESIDRAIPGGFEVQWPLFALENWNRLPIQDYVDWDRLPFEAKEKSQKRVTQSQQVENVVMQPYVLPLAAEYHHFYFDDDTKVSSVLFVNSLTGVDRASVQALVRYHDKANWEAPEDWSKDAYKFLCRDKKAERIAELVLIFTNSEWKDRSLGGRLQPSDDPKLITSNIGCWRWEGTATITAHGSFLSNVTEHSTADILIQRNESEQPSENSYTNFDFLGKKIDWDHSGTLSDCSGKARDSASIQPDDGYFLMYLFKDEPYYSSDTNMPDDLQQDILYTCSNGSQLAQSNVIVGFWNIEQNTFKVSGDGRTLDGVINFTSPEMILTGTQQWHLEAQREP